jgi:hypothetical protein
MSMQTFISLGMFMWVVKIVTKVQKCAILSPKLERIQIFGCNPNVIEPTTIQDNGWKNLVELHGGCDYHCN